MCLSTVTKVYDPPDPKVRRGWKVFRHRYGTLRPDLYSDLGYHYELNKWYLATDMYWKESYPYGFHIFLHEDDAILWRDRSCTPYKHVCPVEARVVVSEGMQHQLFSELEASCFVAREMRILPDDT